jgi:hypothetical protein
MAEWDFGGDEVVFMLGSGACAAVLAVRYYKDLLTVSEMLCDARGRFWLALSPVVCLFIVFVVLGNWSDPQTVRGHADYEILFMIGGAFWIEIAAVTLPILGISIRDDVLERNNRAALIVALGAMLGHTLCYAGANIGAGPTIWTTIVPAIMASGALLVGWLVIELATGVSRTITIDRHVPSGIALAAFAVLAGIDLGWAAAGDWQSWEGTVRDFSIRAWVVVPMILGVVVVLLIIKPRCEFITSGVKA